MSVLPDRFQKIRYFGFMANRYRAANLDLCRRLIGSPSPSPSPVLVKDWKDRYRQLTGEDADLCPACKLGRLLPVETLLPYASTAEVRYDTS